MLHAINASDGTEEWAFVPPMIAAQLPLLINTNYDGQFLLSKKAGGSNAIFGVDGSPVAHDAFILDLKQMERHIKPKNHGEHYCLYLMVVEELGSLY